MIPSKQTCISSYCIDMDLINDCSTRQTGINIADQSCLIPVNGVCLNRGSLFTRCLSYG